MKNLFALILLTIFVYSCSDNGTNPTDTSVLMPLKIGNTWEYVGFYPGETGTETTNYSMTVDSEIEFMGETHYQLKYFSLETKESFISPAYFINTSYGYEIISKDDVDGTIYKTRFKYPAVKGDTISIDDSSIFFVESIDTLITTPAGKFKCIKYVDIINLDGIELGRVYNYFAPGIGLVLSENYDTNYRGELSSPTMKSELKSYKLK